ncbi:MAG: hypothetical protein ACON4O_09670 [Lentimonas sp.]
MISWIQNHLIRHGRWIFLTLLALIIVAFVFTIGNTPGCTTNRSGYQENKFYGIDLNSKRETEVIGEKAQLSAYLNGQNPRSEAEFSNLIVSRIAMLHLADEIGMPGPSQEAMGAYIRTKRAFIGPDKQFSADAYTSFVDSVETNPRLRDELIGLVLEEDYRIEQLASVISGPGFTLPSEAIAQVRSSETTLKLTTAEIRYNEFNPEVEIPALALEEFYSANSFRYQIPERIEASYVAFPASDYTDQVTEATDAELREHFISNRSKFADDFEASQPETAEGEERPAMKFEDVREAVVASYTAEAASRIANEAAQTFAYQLYNKEIERDSAGFDELVNESNLTLIPIEPYTADGAVRRKLSVEMLQSAFALNDKRYYSDAYPINGAFAVLIYQGRIAPEIPELEAIKVEVTEDYKTERKRDLFSEEGIRLKEALDAKITEGASFEDAATALNLEVNKFDSFVVREPPRELNRALLQNAQAMESGDLSPMITVGDIGSFIFVESKEAPEISTNNEDFERAQQFLTFMATSSSSSSLINELVSRGMPEPDDSSGE